ncbi:hypothetical protein ACFPM7_04980 [Actinokineospora guangxiensis]|uniref:Uncharacterized protein n=1 Tax=Actinokineospora guangxiensis TaxID=1490288 RepID=A0ABW0EJQ4_9PSEU
MRAAAAAVEDDSAGCAVTLPGSFPSTTRLPVPFRKLDGNRITSSSISVNVNHNGRLLRARRAAQRDRTVLRRPIAVSREGTPRNNKQGAFYTACGSSSSTGLLAAWAWGQAESSTSWNSPAARFCGRTHSASPAARDTGKARSPSARSTSASP